MCAVTAVPYRRQPPPDAFVHAWSFATVLPREWAVTVMTRVALPVPKRRGSGTPRCSAAWRGALGRGAGAEAGGRLLRAVVGAAATAVRRGAADVGAGGRELA